MTVTAPVAFTGLIVVRGATQLLAPGSLIRGSLVSLGPLNAVGTTFEFSRCALAAAAQAAATPRPVHGRAWVELW